MSKARSRLLDRPDSSFRQVKGIPVVLHFGRQAKHIPSLPNFVPGKSILTINLARLQELVEEKAGTGTWTAAHKELVDFGEPIGLKVSKSTGDAVPTPIGIIHYSKQGLHVVPADPN